MERRTRRELAAENAVLVSKLEALRDDLRDFLADAEDADDDEEADDLGDNDDADDEEDELDGDGADE